MTRKRSFLIVSALVLGVLLTGALLLSRNNKTPVNFSLPSGTAVSVLDKNGKVIEQTGQSRILSLEPGVYELSITASQDQETTTTNITVNDYEISYEVSEPSYKKEYLENYLTKNRQKIDAVLINLTNGNEVVNREAIFGNAGKFYYLALIQSPESGAIKRVILEEKNDIWELLDKPDYIISKYNMPEYAIEAVKAVNQLDAKIL